MTGTGRDDPTPARDEPPSRDLAENGPASTTHLPHKPTRDAATREAHPGGLARDHAAPDADPPVWAGIERQEVGGPTGNRRHPPHPTENDEEADPDRHPGEPVLPANASGADRFPVEELEQPIEEESMYDGRPSQDKDRPPSDAVH